MNYIRVSVVDMFLALLYATLSTGSCYLYSVRYTEPQPDGTVALSCSLAKTKYVECGRYTSPCTPNHCDTYNDAIRPCTSLTFHDADTDLMISGTVSMETSKYLTFPSTGDVDSATVNRLVKDHRVSSDLFGDDLYVVFTLRSDSVPAGNYYCEVRIPGGLPWIQWNRLAADITVQEAGFNVPAGSSITALPGRSKGDRVLKCTVTGGTAQWKIRHISAWDSWKSDTIGGSVVSGGNALLQSESLLFHDQVWTQLPYSALEVMLTCTAAESGLAFLPASEHVYSQPLLRDSDSVYYDDRLMIVLTLCIFIPLIVLLVIIASITACCRAKCCS